AAGRVLILCGEAGIGRYLVSRQARRRARGERPVEQGTRRATVRQRLHGRGAPLWRPCEARRPLAHAAGPTARRLRLRRWWTGGRGSGGGAAVPPPPLLCASRLARAFATE